MLRCRERAVLQSSTTVWGGGNGRRATLLRWSGSCAICAWMIQAQQTSLVRDNPREARSQEEDQGRHRDFGGSVCCPLHRPRRSHRFQQGRLRLLQVDCPGCHFPCAKCGSAKCGVECRRNRNWVYEQLEIDGVPNTVYKNPLLK
ncbi:hypothetical protein HPB48_000555 [Haemaphysalis longicornis]|uniref:ARF7 effector protein C-terminal domain-containing protein n=1 Tax=Haemaphysalis longicornis TaxID=44386 RepID=A0A9J6FUF5_HAELO|nr:hypothetical protein HPB48_000555 [Haemaphysalis longicornis]